MVNAVPYLKTITSNGFVATFGTIALLTVPSSIIAVNSAASLAKRVQKMLPATKKEPQASAH
jgi:hypothetical protein